MDRYQTWWVRIGLLNLGIVALLGAVMRYKIGFSLPYFDQKFLQEAHSHFAFAGWISHSLFFLMVRLFHSHLDSIRTRRYQWLISLNLFSAYGMLISFAVQGYGPVSLVFSTISVLVSYVFSYDAWKDAGRLAGDHPARKWIRAAVFFAALSTVGTMVLSQMMATRQYDQTTYLGSIYFYLHFQYNGWFTFACIGLFLSIMRQSVYPSSLGNKAFWCFFLAGLPAYFLSTLWAQLPTWLYVFVMMAALLQLLGWWYLFQIIRQCLGELRQHYPAWVRWLWLVVGLAFTLKLLLQLGSVHPEVSHLATGFRPIVIAYLHLVLLLIISVFILVYFQASGLMQHHAAGRVAMIAFTLGAILNEVILAVQGIGAFSYTIIPMANPALFIAALLLLGSAVAIFLSQFRIKRS